MFMGPSIFEIIFIVMFLLFIVAFVGNIVKGLGEWNKNNNSPRLTVDANVVAKRTNTTHHTHSNGGDVSGASGCHTTTSTTYYVTFQVESGDRMEFRVNGIEYGMLTEGDFGKLTFQGTRYLEFKRTI